VGQWTRLAELLQGVGLQPSQNPDEDCLLIVDLQKSSPLPTSKQRSILVRMEPPGVNPFQYSRKKVGRFDAIIDTRWPPEVGNLWWKPPVNQAPHSRLESRWFPRPRGVPRCQQELRYQILALQTAPRRSSCGSGARTGCDRRRSGMEGHARKNADLPPFSEPVALRVRGGCCSNLA